MIGFSHISNWQAGIIPLLNLFIGSFFFFCLIGFGRFLMKALRIEIYEPWDLVCRLILGIFSLSLINQIIAIFNSANNVTYSILFIFFTIFGVCELKNIQIMRIKFEKINLIPLIILSLIFISRFLLAIIPSTKMDELYYHMLFPSRIISDNALNYYHFPWESAIWPHMHYQFISTPFYSLGFPESVNIITISVFITFVYIASFLVYKSTQNINLSLWCAVLISSGLHSTVDLITNASTSLLILSAGTSLIILSKPAEYLPSSNLKSFSIFFSLLFIGIIGSKISMAPIAILLIFIFFITTKKYWSSYQFKNAFFFFLVPIIIFYFPLLVLTWIKSGSPFGPILSSLFYVEDVILDPLTDLANNKIGATGLKELLIALLTKWSTLIWIGWLILPHQKIDSEAKLKLTIVFLAQFFIIWAFLPDRPRHFGGFQYCALIICFTELIPSFYERYKKYSIMIFLLFSIPWLALDFYYSLPLISKAFSNADTFKKEYIPMHVDFMEIDKLIEKNAQLLISPNIRLNSFHSPRDVYMYKGDIIDKNRPTYLISDDSLDKKIIKNYNLEKLIYENPNANLYCRRRPGYSCSKRPLKVYRINFNTLEIMN